ncbi:hypothetical protein GCM10009733_020160 [Nonomuraea maheshkhaliensis]|uniref:Uncharacterized protein n=1 Tax=Nonomuraea maheshkhaliensis TaxID=419590 RepID=A0ABN2EZA7_9ACTN
MRDITAGGTKALESLLSFVRDFEVHLAQDKAAGKASDPDLYASQAHDSVRRFVAAQGLESFGKRGQEVLFNPDLHSMTAGTPGRGNTVRIAAPGWIWRREGEPDAIVRRALVDITGKIAYHVYALNARNTDVHERLYPDWAITADRPTLQEAREVARTMVTSDPRIARVGIRESIQEYEGGGWKPGWFIEHIERREPSPVRPLHAAEPDITDQALLDNAYQIGTQALREYQTRPYGDLRLDAARASAKVVAALASAGRLASLTRGADAVAPDHA